MTKDERRKRKAALRVQAAMEYISNPSMPTVADVHADSRFHGVSRRTLERWCLVDRWVERREEFTKAWMDEARSKLGTRLAQERLHELEMLRHLKNLGLGKVEDPMLLPKSWEATVKVILDIAKREDELRQAIGDEVIGSTPSNTLTMGDGKYTDEELLAASKEILRLRTEKGMLALPENAHIELELNAEDDDDDETSDNESSGSGTDQA